MSRRYVGIETSIESAELVMMEGFPGYCPDVTSTVELNVLVLGGNLAGSTGIQVFYV